ncbi:MAG: Hsp70 family protein [Kiritimatiellae bacterium]|nr:Hsp70 family protein [Kiritimatiellia bacterium]
MTIGIDFGTTKTIISWMNPRNGHVETIKCFNHKDQIPTHVFVNEDGECVFGERAKLEGTIDPLGSWEKFKLELGSKELLVDRGKGRNGKRGMDAVDLTARFLKFIKKTCEATDEFKGCAIDNVIITIPVVFTTAQRRDLETAAKLAGFDNITIKLEPEAAALAYMKESPSQWSRALIVDWGGGTLDTALIEDDGRGNFICNRKYSRGLDDIGGEEIDRKFVNYVIERFREHGAVIPEPDSVDYDGSQDSAERRAQLATELFRLRNGILEDKVNLDSHEVYSFYPKGGRGNSPRHAVKISQDDFRTQAKDEIDKACELVENILQEIPNGQKPEKLFVAGGTCWSDVIKNALQEASGLEVIRGTKSREVVALGAAYLARPEVLPPVLPPEPSPTDSGQRKKGFTVVSPCSPDYGKMVGFKS